MKKLIVFCFLIVLYPINSYANNTVGKDDLDFILTACGGSNTSEEKAQISANLVKLLEENPNGVYENTSKQKGISLIFNGFKDEEKKSEAMKFFPECIQKMMISMKDFLSEDQKKTLSQVITIVTDNSERSNDSSDLKIKLFQSTECENISNLENAKEVAIIEDGTIYCDSKNRVLLKFKITDDNSNLEVKASNLISINNFHYINSYDIRDIKFPDGKIRYFQISNPVKENEGKKYFQLNFVEKPDDASS